MIFDFRKRKGILIFIAVQSLELLIAQNFFLKVGCVSVVRRGRRMKNINQCSICVTGECPWLDFGVIWRDVLLEGGRPIRKTFVFLCYFSLTFCYRYFSRFSEYNQFLSLMSSWYGCGTNIFEPILTPIFIPFSIRSSRLMQVWWLQSSATP
jgi:hypothetical protein